MPSERFVAALNEQIGHEFAASQQYVACAVHYDAETLPRLAGFFYAQALEERGHAMMMVRYLLDQDAEPILGTIEGPTPTFSDVVAPVALALEQEKRVTQQINGLVALAREDDDFASEQFLQWFVKEQVEEVSSMSDLLRVVERAADNPIFAEEHLARESGGDEDDPTAPPAADA